MPVRPDSALSLSVDGLLFPARWRAETFVSIGTKSVGESDCFCRQSDIEMAICHLKSMKTGLLSLVCFLLLLRWG